MSKKILVLRNDALGDVVLSCPLLSTIKKQWPSAHLTVLCKTYTSSLLKRHTAVDEVVLDFKSNHKRPWFMNFIDAVRYFKKKNIDVIFFPIMDAFYVWAAFFAGVKVRVGDKHQLLLSPLLTTKVNIAWRDISKHEVQQQCRLLSPFCDDIDDCSFGLELPQEALHEFDESYKDLAEKKWIVIHPSYGKGNRGWSAKAYAALIDRILESTDYKVCLTGAGADKDITDVIYKLCETKPLNLTNKTSLDDLMILIKKASLVIGAETGPTHLASAFNTPVLSLSPTKFIQSFRWGPWNTNHVVMKDNKQCPLVCHTYKKDCAATYCLESILLDDVLKAMTFLLTGQAFPSSPLHYWFVANATVAIHIDKLEDSDKPIAMYQQLKMAGITVFFTTTNQDLYQKLKETDMEVLYQSKWNLLFWVKWISIQNVSVWHIVNHDVVPFFFKLVSALSALNINLPPLVLFKDADDSTLKNRLDTYFEHFKSFSEEIL